MDRRSFLKSTSAAAAATATTVAAEQSLAAPAVTTAREEIRAALSPRFQTGYLRDRADRLALRLREISDGALRLEFEMTDDHGLDAVGRGAAVAYFGTEADHVAHHPALAYFSALPGAFGLTPEHFSTWLSAGAGQLHWDEAAAELGVKAFAAGHSGRQPGLWATTDDIALAALPDLTVSTSGIAKIVAGELGLKVNGANIASDLVEPLAGTTAAMTEMDHRIWYSNGFNHAGTALSLGVSRALWDRLLQSDQALLTSVATEAYHQAVAEHDAHDREVAPHLFAARNIARKQLPNDIARAISHVSSQVLVDLATQGSTVARIHESYMQFRSTVTGLAAPGRNPAAV